MTILPDFPQGVDARRTMGAFGRKLAASRAFVRFGQSR